LSVGEVQAHREGGDELRAAELQELLVRGHLLVGAPAGAADVAHDRRREAGEQARADAVAHRVQAGQVQVVGVDVVVEAVPAHLIGGDELAGDGEVLAADGAQRLQVPLHLSGDGQRLGAPRDLHHVGAHDADDQDVGDGEAEVRRSQPVLRRVPARLTRPAA
jgi:hypothetical protein